MATIRQIIALVDDRKPNSFTASQKLRWISELDGLIALDVLMLHPVEVRRMEYPDPDGLDQEPIVRYPHDEIYELWLEAKIDYANGEYNKYQNSMEAYNAAYENFVRWFAQTYAPADGYWRREPS